MWELLTRLFPGTRTGSCALCRQRVAGDDARRQLCQHCLTDLPWLADAEQIRIDPLAPISRQITPLSYEGAPRQWVLAAKQERGLVAARILGTLLTETLLAAYPSGVRRPELLLPMPLSLRRLMVRGHNQAIQIALPAARALDIPLDRWSAQRRRHTAIQPGLDARARIANVSGAFATRRRFDGVHVAIVDDVVTTGASAHALATALLAAGAASVHLWCPTRARGTATLSAPSSARR